TYHGIPRIPVQVRGSETTNFALYRWQPTNLGDIPFMNHQFLQMGSNNVRLFEELRGNCKAHPAIQEANLVRRSSQPFDPKNGQQQEAPLTAAPGEQLPLSLYWLAIGPQTTCAVSSADSEETKYETGPVFQFGIAVANANITLKRGPQNVFVFVTNLTDA